MAPVTEQLYFADRDAWRAWLEQNHAIEKEAWLVHYKKHARKPGISYEDAVEEALCFGWIDGMLRTIDDERYALRYSPRRKNAIWSESNKKRAEQMMTLGLMTQAGLAKVRQAKESGEWDKATLREMLEFPHDLEKSLAVNKEAERNFQRLTPSRRKQLIWWVMGAKRKETREQRVKEIARLVAEKDDSDPG